MSKYIAAILLVLLFPLSARSGLSPIEKHSLEERIDHDKAVLNAAVKKAFDQLLNDYRAISKIYIKNGDPEDAAAILKERDRMNLLATRPIAGIPMVQGGWTILFQSSNPLLWDIDCSNSDSYSISIGRAPHDCKYLRIKRMDTGDYVVIPLHFQDLNACTYHTAAFFRGDKRINRQACNLGIIDEKHIVSDQSAFMAMENSGHHSGWGFGESGADEKQTWQWDSDGLPATIMQISVSSCDLTSIESSKLLRVDR